MTRAPRARGSRPMNELASEGSANAPPEPRAAASPSSSSARCRELLATIVGPVVVPVLGQQLAAVEGEGRPVRRRRPHPPGVCRRLLEPVDVDVGREHEDTVARLDRARNRGRAVPREPPDSGCWPRRTGSGRARARPSPARDGRGGRGPARAASRARGPSSAARPSRARRPRRRRRQSRRGASHERRSSCRPI